MVPTSCLVRPVFWTASFHKLLTRITPGEVVEGIDIVDKVESLGSASGTPKARITISNSGTV